MCVPPGPPSSIFEAFKIQRRHLDCVDGVFGDLFGGVWSFGVFCHFDASIHFREVLEEVLRCVDSLLEVCFDVAPFGVSDFTVQTHEVAHEIACQLHPIQGVVIAHSE